MLVVLICSPQDQFNRLHSYDTSIFPTFVQIPIVHLHLWGPILTEMSQKWQSRPGKSIGNQYQIMWRGSTVLTADRAWPGHGLWLRGTGLGCRGWFCWAGPNLQCYCYYCHCCWCCCLDSGWVEPLGVMAWWWVSRIGGERVELIK